MVRVSLGNDLLFQISRDKMTHLVLVALGSVPALSNLVGSAALPKDLSAVIAVLSPQYQGPINGSPGDIYGMKLFTGSHLY